MTGFVAATGQSYLCPDTTHDPLYLEGAAGARSSLTVPLIYHGTVIGTLNVENAQPNAFDDRDRQFLEIYARNVASALNTLELLQAEKFSAATASVEAISRELALPLDDILSDATTVLDRYAGHDEDIIARLRHLLYRAREIRSLIQKVGSTIAPEPKPERAAARAPAGQRPAAGGRRRRDDPALGPPPARLPGGDRRDGPRRPRGDRPGPADALLRRAGRHPPARPRRLRDLQAAPRGPARRADHPDDRVRLRPLALDRQGPPGGPADRPLQAVPGRPPAWRPSSRRCAFQPATCRSAACHRQAGGPLVRRIAPSKHPSRDPSLMSQDWLIVGGPGRGTGRIARRVDQHVARAGSRPAAGRPDPVRPARRALGADGLGHLGDSASVLGAWPWPVWGYALACLATALVGLPAATSGPAPTGAGRRGSPTRRRSGSRPAHGADALIGRGRYAFLLRIPGNESLRLRKCDWRGPAGGPAEEPRRPDSLAPERLPLAPLLRRAGSSRRWPTRWRDGTPTSSCSRVT